MEPRVLRVERVFPNSFLQGRDYSWFQMVFNSLVEEIKFRIVGCFMDGQARFVMNREMYRLFYSVAPMIKGPYWDGIRIEEDLTPECLPWNKDTIPKYRILLEYREPVYIPFELTERRSEMSPKDGFSIKEIYFSIPGNLKIKKVIFNNPATIVIWNDGTKTVVKAQEGDGWDMEKGLAMCVAKRFIGLKDFYKVYNKAVDKYWEENNK